MCGIAGIVDRASSPERLGAVLDRMLPGVASRGPDGVGKAIRPGVGLLHTRLAIIDLQTGDQPIWNERGTVGCIFNGEIYNYRMLREGLCERGHTFSTTSDTEVLVHLYEDFGEKLLEHIRGMYALAVYDDERGRVLLARDRLGIKPLFLTDLGSGVAFSSAIDSLLAAGASPNLDHRALAQYFQFHRIPEPRTAYASVKALPPGESLVLDIATGRREQRRFYSRPTPRTPVDAASAVQAARLAFEHAVASHLVADVEVAAFLSGGIDSSLVVGQAQRLANRPLRTYCVSFRGPGAVDEASFADDVARRLGTRHRTLEVTAPPAELVRLGLAAAQQPFGVASFLPLLLLCETASRDVKVVLTGDGGDEVGFGYPWYRWALMAGRVPRRLRYEAALPLQRAERAIARLRTVRAARRSVKFLRGALLGGAQAADVWRHELDATEAMRALHPDLRGTLEPVETPTQESWRLEMSDVDALRCSDLEILLRDEMLPKLDRAGMAFGLEGRVPLLDDDFVDSMLAVPSAIHLAHRHGKALMRSWAAELVPGINLSRRKHGFDVPIRAWLQGPLRDDVDRLLLRPSRRQLVDPSFARLAWSRAMANLSGAGHDVYAMLVASLWFEAKIGT